MKTAILAAIVATFALLPLFASGTARAQMGRMDVPTPQGIFNPVVGSGAQYEMDRSACRFRRSTQHLLAVYSPESGSLAFFLGVD